VNISSNNLKKLDDVDMKVIRELGENARISNLALASKIGVSHSTVGRRINRLVGDGIINLAAVPNYHTLGYNTFLTLAINAPPGKLNALVEKLISVNGIGFLWTTAGRYDILAMARYRNPEEYLTRFPAEIGDIPDNARIEIMSNVKLVKSKWTHAVDDEGTASHQPYTPTELDFAVISALGHSPRASVNELAKMIGARVSSVRYSLRKLLSHDTVQVRAVRNPEALGNTIKGITFIQANPCKLNALTDRLKLHPSVEEINLIFGAFNCMIWTTFETSSQMYDFLDRKLGSMPGVMKIDNLISLRMHQNSQSFGGESKSGKGFS